MARLTAKQQSYLGVCLWVVLWANVARAFTPESPEVQQMIQRSLAYLAKRSDARPGGKCLVGLAFLNQRQPDHPRVKEALDTALSMSQQKLEDLVGLKQAYSLAIAPIFLCEFDPDLYRSEIEALLAAVWRRQTSQGSWTYINQQDGDTSMTQYGVLACWEAHSAGFNVPQEVVLKASGWLLRTQDKGGGFGYRPTDPGRDDNRLEQGQVRESITAAGLGSLYVCSTLLGVNARVAKSSGLMQEIPDVFVPVPSRSQGAMGIRVNRGYIARIKRALTDGNRWYASHQTVSPKQYPYYYLYALERYQSFRELAEGSKAANPGWYDAGVRHLMDQQREDGSFAATSEIGVSVATAFAVLFLQRSTKKSIRESSLGEGLLVGGRGLPDDLRQIRVVDGRVVSALEKKTLAGVVKMLGDPQNIDAERFAKDKSALLIDSGGELSEEENNLLHGFLRSSNPEIQIVAIRALAARRSLDDVPELISLLTHENLEVVGEARNALRKVTRKFEGMNMPLEADKRQRQEAADAWTKWYRREVPSVGGRR